VKAGDRVLDLGCGPGLYASRLCERGMTVTGIDISPRSIEYAMQSAGENGLEIEYIQGNFFDIEYPGEYDVTMQIYGELNTFSDTMRDIFLARIHDALTDSGLFIFDVSTRVQRLKEGAQNHWYSFEGGLWRPGKHLILEEGFDYPEHDVWLDQYIVIDENGITVYRDWFHDYSLDTIRDVLEKAGFSIVQVWNDLTGTPYQDGGDWIAIVARKA
jgi:SAM-dependent methyltransferase